MSGVPQKKTKLEPKMSVTFTADDILHAACVYSNLGINKENLQTFTIEDVNKSPDLFAGGDYVSYYVAQHLNPALRKLTDKILLKQSVPDYEAGVDGAKRELSAALMQMVMRFPGGADRSNIEKFLDKLSSNTHEEQANKLGDLVNEVALNISSALRAECRKRDRERSLAN